MFDGFTMERLAVGELTLRARVGGSGPPLLLLHGHPQTHVMWHRVAPKLAEAFTVIAPDLPGYGESSAPPTSADHVQASKRAMGLVMVDLMAQLGFDRFGLAGHDRGGRVAYRLALDNPAATSGLAVLDIVPTGVVWAHMDAELATEFWHWVFLARTAPLPERLLAGDPNAYYFSDDRSPFAPAALDDYLAACRRPEAIHTMCEDYRAAATIDRALDDADLAAGRRIRGPVLALWSTRERHERWYDPLETWRTWADDPASVRGRAIDAGHYLAEEAPDEVAAELSAFFSEVQGLNQAR